jgi:thiol-disulfide isomerase/thioredoxin
MPQRKSKGSSVLMMKGCTSLPRVSASDGGEREKMLMGKINKEELFRQCPVFQESAARYVPDPAAVKGLKEIDKKTEILVFLGIWCPDSISEVPRLFKVYDEVGNPNLTLQLIGVDRAMQDSLGLSQKFEIQRVPTFIFLRDGKELGRVIEFPNKTIEEDALNLMSRP